MVRTNCRQPRLTRPRGPDKGAAQQRGPPAHRRRRHLPRPRRPYPPRGAVLAEQHDEWIESRRYLGLDVLSKSRTDTPTDTATEEVVTTPALTA